MLRIQMGFSCIIIHLIRRRCCRWHCTRHRAHRGQEKSHCIKTSINRANAYLSYVDWSRESYYMILYECVVDCMRFHYYILNLLCVRWSFMQFCMWSSCVQSIVRHSSSSPSHQLARTFHSSGTIGFSLVVFFYVLASPRGAAQTHTLWCQWSWLTVAAAASAKCSINMYK